ncbi:MAG: ROK family protein [Ilumatobacteraceae bacterium]
MVVPFGIVAAALSDRGDGWLLTLAPPRFVIYYYKMRNETQAPIAGARAVRSAHVRRSNLGVVLGELRQQGPMSRSDLVASTGLTRNAIGELVGSLVDGGLAAETTPAPDGRPGRPSTVVRVDERHVAVLAIEIGVDDTVVAAVGLDGAVIGSARTARQGDPVPVASTVADIVSLVRSLVGSGGRVERRRVLGVGAAVPGLVRRSDGVVVSAPNLGWIDVSFAAELGAELQAQIGRPMPVHVGNEADLGALAEARFGVGRSADVMVFVSGEVGVGGGVVMASGPVSGRSGFACEFGHMPVNPDGDPCRCGSNGCWETEVGERSLLRRAGLDPDGGSEAVAVLLERFAAGEPAALAAIAEEGRWLGIGITGLINLFDPDVVVLGGLFRRILPGARPALEAELDRRRFRGVERDVAVVAGSLEPSAALIGAAELAFGPLLADPAAGGK